MATYNSVSTAASYYADNIDTENNFSNSWCEHTNIVYTNAATEGLSAEHIVRHKSELACDTVLMQLQYGQGWSCTTVLSSWF
jgi:hypothetical protein